MFQMKEQDKTPEEPSDVEIGNLPEKEFRVMIVKVIQGLGRKMDKLEGFFNRVRKYKEQPNRVEQYNN